MNITYFHKMQLVIKVSLFESPYTICFITDDYFVMPDEQCYKSVGTNTGDYCQLQIETEGTVRRKALKYRVSALFLQPFVKECLNSEAFRANVLSYLKKLSGYPDNGVLLFKLILEPPDKEIIDYAWNERVLKLVWTRVVIENAFSWLSTLGGAYSALGDYFEHCAEEAGRISMRQYKLSRMLGDDSLAARSRLYSALSHAQKGNLKLSRHIVRNVADFGRLTQDRRLMRMCQGVWVKLKYMRKISNNSEAQIININSQGDDGKGNGKVDVADVN